MLQNVMTSNNPIDQSTSLYQRHKIYKYMNIVEVVTCIVEVEVYGHNFFINMELGGQGKCPNSISMWYIGSLFITFDMHDVD